MTKEELFTKYHVNISHKGWDPAVDNFALGTICQLMCPGEFPSDKGGNYRFVTDFLDRENNDWWKANVENRFDALTLFVTAKKFIFAFSDNLLPDINSEILIPKPDDVLRGLLRERAVAFSFKKADGSIREAIGTTSTKLIPKYTEAIGTTSTKFIPKYTELDILCLIESATMASHRLSAGEDYTDALEHLNNALVPFLPKKESTRTPNPTIVTFFDLACMEWRSCKAENILDIH